MKKILLLLGAAAAVCWWNGTPHSQYSYDITVPTWEELRDCAQQITEAVSALDFHAERREPDGNPPEITIHCPQR